jgi:hypothetical protein
VLGECRKCHLTRIQRLRADSVRPDNLLDFGRDNVQPEFFIVQFSQEYLDVIIISFGSQEFEYFTSEFGRHSIRKNRFGDASGGKENRLLGVKGY